MLDCDDRGTELEKKLLISVLIFLFAPYRLYWLFVVVNVVFGPAIEMLLLVEYESIFVDHIQSLLNTYHLLIDKKTTTIKHINIQLLNIDQF